MAIKKIKYTRKTQTQAPAAPAVDELVSELQALNSLRDNKVKALDAVTDANDALRIADEAMKNQNKKVAAIMQVRGLKQVRAAGYLVSLDDDECPAEVIVCPDHFVTL